MSFQKGKSGHRCVEREGREETQGEDRHAEANEKSLKQILFSRLSELTNPADTLTSDFWTPQL